MCSAPRDREGAGTSARVLMMFPMIVKTGYDVGSITDVVKSNLHTPACTSLYTLTARQ